ncbi:hypothetical protein AMJ85_11420, partial [candidate division BRC1 bacterium SM23_51]
MWRQENKAPFRWLARFVANRSAWPSKASIHLLGLIAVVVLASCARRGGPYDRSYVSERIEERTG